MPDTAASRLAALVWVAAKLHSVTDAELADWAKDELGVEVDARTLRKLAQQWRPVARTGRPSTSASPRRPSRDPAVFDWFRIDEPKLGLIKVIFRLPNDGLPRPGLLESLNGLSGLRQVFETKMDREIIAIGLVRSLEDADYLRARIQEQDVNQAVRMDFIEYEEEEMARLTWLELARKQIADSPSTIHLT